jgi:flagellar motor switch protein FliN/FliY
MPTDEMTQEEIDALLNAGDSGADMDEILGKAQPAPMPEFSAPAPITAGAGDLKIEMLYDVEMEVKIELGRTQMMVEDILRLREGSVIQLDKDAGAPVSILINDQLVAFGEVLVLENFFCVRVTEILSDADRAVQKL